MRRNDVKKVRKKGMKNNEMKKEGNDRKREEMR